MTRGKSRPLRERFWSKVDRSGGPDACWPWTASLRGKGYGAISVGGKNRIAPRVAWHLANGPLADGENVLHRCDNRLCCNPAHLFLGSLSDNNWDMAKKGRHGRSKLSHDDVQRVRAALAECELERDKARESLRLLREKVFGEKGIDDILRSEP